MESRDRDAEGRPCYAGPRDALGRPLPRGSADVLDGRVSPPAAPAEAIRQGAELFDQRRFFEAHETFEHVWKSDRIAAVEAAFWKAVTQVCVGMCHVQRGNPRGARSVLARGAAALDREPRVRRGVDGTALAAAARNVAARCADGAVADDAEFPRFPIVRSG